jgi:hypothetical protein
MYHIARAIVFHTRRKDVDDHDRLPETFGQIVGVSFEDKLEKWRDMFATLSGYFVNRRNVLEYSPYTPTDIVTICSESMSDVQEILAICNQTFLLKRKATKV